MFAWAMLTHPSTNLALTLVAGGTSQDPSVTVAAPELPGGAAVPYEMECVITGATSGNSVVGRFGLLVVKRGDLDLDQAVNATDFNLFLAALGSCQGSTSFIPYADFDEDGCVTFVDYQAWLQGYRLYQGNPLAPPPIEPPGDLNGDGRTDGQDIQGFVNSLLNPASASFRERLFADLNGDGAINEADVQAFSERLLGAAQ